MKIHTLTSIFGVSHAAFYGNAYGNQYIGQSLYPRPVPNGYIPMNNNLHRPGPGTVPSISPPGKKQIHQGKLCGKITNFKLGRGDNNVLKSPHYPQEIDPQTQCSWTIEGPPGSRIRLDFEDFQIFKTGTGCESAYVKIITELDESLKVCGRNPEFLIAPSNTITVKFQADSGKLGTLEGQRFMLRISVTREKTNFPARDGRSITDGRVLGSSPPPTPPRVLAGQSPTRKSPMTSRVTPLMHPGRVPSSSGPVGQIMFPARGSMGQNSVQNQANSNMKYESEEINTLTEKDGDNRVQNIAIIAVVTVLTLFAIVGFVAYKMRFKILRRFKPGSNQEAQK